MRTCLCGARCLLAVIGQRGEFVTATIQVAPVGKAAGTSSRPVEGSKPAGVYLRITRIALRYKGRLAIGLIAIFLASGFQLAIPILIGNAVDTATNLAGDADARAKNALILTAVLLLLASIGRGLAAMIQNYMGESVGQHIGYELRMLYYEKLQRLSFSYHAGVHTC